MPLLHLTNTSVVYTPSGFFEGDEHVEVDVRQVVQDHHPLYQLGRGVRFTRKGVGGA